MVHYTTCTLLDSIDSYGRDLNFEPCHTKTGIKIFVIPKEGVDGTSPVKPFFGMKPPTLP